MTLFDGSDTWVNVGFRSSARHSAICVEKQTNQKNSLFDSDFPVMNSFLFSTGLKGNIESFRDTYRFMKCQSCFWKERILIASCNTGNRQPKYPRLTNIAVFSQSGFYIDNCLVYYSTPNLPRVI